MIEPLKYYDEKGLLHFHLLDVGEGLMTLIVFPNQKVMLFDCNVRKNEEDEILKYLGRFIPYKLDEITGQQKQYIDVFVNSHRDEDHYRGLKHVNKKYPIKSIWDSGQSGETTKSQDYQYYMNLRRKLRDYDEKKLVVMCPDSRAYSVESGVSIYCLASSDEDTYGQLRSGLGLKTKDQHTNSIVLLIEYNRRKFIMTGDSDWLSWRERIVANFPKELLKSEMLIASHHGSRTFFTDEEIIDFDSYPNTTFLDSMDCISPTLTLISCGDYSSASHPNKEAKVIYDAKTSNEQVYTTYKNGDLVGFIDSKGNYSVVPSSFRKIDKKKISFHDFKIKCYVISDNQENEVENNSFIPIGSNLEFRVELMIGLDNLKEAISVFWNVSNCGINNDHEHQEIYSIEYNDHNFVNAYVCKRVLSYVGKHLLKCTVKYNGNLISRIFVVNGV